MPVCVTARRFILALMLWALPGSVMAMTFDVDEAQIYRIGKGYTVNAQISYPLPRRVQEALENGVPITFFQEVQLVKRIPVLWDLWQWDRVIWSSEIHYALRYHDLSKQFMLHSLDAENHRNFTTLDSALTAMGSIANLSLPPALTEDLAGKILRLRSGIDIAALPSPMRPGAMISDKWDLTSPWFKALWPSD